MKVREKVKPRTEDEVEAQMKYLSGLSATELGIELNKAYAVLREMMRRGYTVKLEITTPKEGA